MSDTPHRHRFAKFQKFGESKRAKYGLPKTKKFDEDHKRGIKEILEGIINLLPPPEGDLDAPLRAMLVDSWYDPYLGVIILVRIIDGSVKRGQKIKMLSNFFSKFCI